MKLVGMLMYSAYFGANGDFCQHDICTLAHQMSEHMAHGAYADARTPRRILDGPLFGHYNDGHSPSPFYLSADSLSFSASAMAMLAYYYHRENRPISLEAFDFAKTSAGLARMADKVTGIDATGQISRRLMPPEMLIAPR